jgi:hypothetical protein
VATPPYRSDINKRAFLWFWREQSKVVFMADAGNDEVALPGLALVERYDLFVNFGVGGQLCCRSATDLGSWRYRRDVLLSVLKAISVPETFFCFREEERSDQSPLQIWGNMRQQKPYPALHKRNREAGEESGEEAV